MPQRPPAPGPRRRKPVLLAVSIPESQSKPQPKRLGKPVVVFLPKVQEGVVALSQATVEVVQLRVLALETVEVGVVVSVVVSVVYLERLLCGKQH